MNRIWTFGLIFLLLFGSLCFGQNAKFQDFKKFFQPVEFEYLHVYSFARIPGKFASTSLYPFKGEKVDSTYFTLFENVIEPIDMKASYSDFYAAYRFYLTGKQEVFLLREFHEGGSEHHIHFLVYDHAKQNFVKSRKLSYAYGYEGAWGQQESWLLDLNQDGILDLVTRKYSESFIGADAEKIVEDSVLIGTWKNDDFVFVNVQDSVLKKSLEQKFPFYSNPKYQLISKDLEVFLEKKLKIRKEKFGKWNVIIAKDTSHAQAEIDIEIANSMFGDDPIYGINRYKFSIYHKNGFFHVLVGDFNTKNQAEIAMSILLKSVTDKAFVVDLEKWCEKRGYSAKFHCAVCE